MERIRIINDKTGEVKHVSKLVADNTKTLAMYGFKVQHLEKKELVEEIEIQVLNEVPKKGRKPNKI
jgi:hypothetical protein